MLNQKYTKKTMHEDLLNFIMCHSSEILRFIHYYLQSVVKEIPSYIIYSNDFIKKIINLSIPKDSMLVTMGIKFSRRSIPNREGMAAVKKRGNKLTNKTISIKITKIFLAIILTLSNFICNSKYYFKINVFQ